MKVGKFLDNEIDRLTQKLQSRKKLCVFLLNTGISEIEVNDAILVGISHLHLLLHDDPESTGVAARIATALDLAPERRDQYSQIRWRFEKVQDDYALQITVARTTPCESRKLRVRRTQEFDMMVCGDVPDGYEVIEEYKAES